MGDDALKEDLDIIKDTLNTGEDESTHLYMLIVHTQCTHTNQTQYYRFSVK